MFCNFDLQNCLALNTHALSLSLYFKVGRILDNPFVLFANTNCSETSCPANGGCGDYWKAPLFFTDHFDNMTYDPTITLSCTGLKKNCKMNKTVNINMQEV